MEATGVEQDKNHHDFNIANAVLLVTILFLLYVFNYTDYNMRKDFEVTKKDSRNRIEFFSAF